MLAEFDRLEIGGYLTYCFGNRWRDVKLRAFEQAKHRTYVDLKVWCHSILDGIGLGSRHFRAGLAFGVALREIV